MIHDSWNKKNAYNFLKRKCITTKCKQTKIYVHQEKHE